MSGKNWQHVGKLTDIPLRGSRRLQNGSHTIALFRTKENKVFALADACPHKKGPLSQGIVHNNCVTCPLHNWVISLETGEAQGADKGSTPMYPVKIENDDILLELSNSVATALEDCGSSCSTSAHSR